jgi:hypothetical protein
LRERLRRDAVQGQRHRIEGAGDHARAGPRGFEAGRERRASGPLTVEAHGQAARLSDPLHELTRLRRLQRARGVVDEHAGGPELA